MLTTNIDSNTQIYNPFPTFIYKTKLDIDVDKVLNKIETFVDRDKDWGLWTSHWSHPNLEDIDPIFSDISSKIVPHADQFYALSKNINLIPIMTIKRMWFNVYRHGGWMRPHDHYEVYYGSTLYLKTNKSSKIAFTHPSQIKFNTTIEFDPEPGDLLIWPGWMLHEVTPNYELDNERVTLSSKIDYKIPHVTHENRRVDVDLFENSSENF